MMALALLREHPLPRHPRFLVLDWAFELPWISTAIRRLGGVVASPYNALRLLEQDELVAVFPEGAKGTGKPFSDRYRLQRFGRGGFVELALRTGAPIVPVAVVGSEEIYPKLADVPVLARLIGAPFFPVTPTFPWLGPLGARAAAVEVADRVLRPDRDGRLPGGAPWTTARSSSSSRSGCARRSSRRSTRTWSSAARRSSEWRRPAAPRESFSGGGAQGSLSIPEASDIRTGRGLEVHAAQEVGHRHRLGGHLLVGLLVALARHELRRVLAFFAACESGKRL